VIETLVRGGAWLSVALLTAGMVLFIVSNAGSRADLVLNSGLVLLMTTPVARVLAALTEEIRVREWRFAALGAAVLILLCGSLVIARL
jgi:uncharacterized membrane protein